MSRLNVRGTRPLCVMLVLEYEDGTQHPMLLHGFDHERTRGAHGPLVSERIGFQISARACAFLGRIQEATAIAHCLIKAAGGEP